MKYLASVSLAAMALASCAATPPARMASDIPAEASVPAETRGAPPAPLSGQRLVVQSLDKAQTGWTSEDGHILPLLVPLQDVPGRPGELPVNAAMLQDLPHAIVCLYHL